MDPDPEGTDSTHTKRPPATTEGELHHSRAAAESHTQREFRQQLDSLRSLPSASSGPVPQQPDQVRICGDATPTDYNSDPTHTVANNPLFSHEDDLVAADEDEDDEAELTLSRGRTSRKTRQRHTSVPPRDAAQVATTSAARPTTTAGREALKTTEQQKNEQTSSYYASQIDKWCKALWHLMGNTPQVTVDRQDNSNEADNYYNNSVAEGLLKTHIERIKEAQREVGNHVVAWSNLENSQTTKKLIQAEANRKALHLAQSGGQSTDIQRQELARWAVLAASLTLNQWGRGTGEEPSQFLETPTNSYDPRRSLRRSFAGVAVRPAANQGSDHQQNAADPSSIFTGDFVSHPPPAANPQPGIAELMLMMQQQAQQQQVQLQQQLQQQAQQQQALMQQQLQQQAQQHQALMQQQLQQQAQQQQALMQQQSQQQQALMQQCIQPMMQCVQQQHQSQESMVKLVAKLVKEKETTVPHTTATTSAHTHVGNAERSHTLARQPEATPAETPESSGTGTTFNGAPTEEDEGGIDGTYGDAYENFTARGGTAYAPSTFPAARGGFTRGRGGTPHMTSTYASHTATPHTGQFKLPEPEPFKGDIQDWPRFWEEWTHYLSQTMPDDISKCRLLKKLLQGSVRDITQCYRDTSADYKNLSEALKKRFDKPGSVRSCLRRKLADIPRQERESPAALRAFFTQIEAVLRQLKDVGEDTEHYSFVDMVELKLGQRLSAHVIPQKRTCKPDEWTMSKLLTLVENYVLDEEEIAINRDVTSSQTIAKEKDGRDHYAKRVNTLQTHSNPYEEEIPVGCELEPEATQSPARQPPAPEVNPPAVFNIQLEWPKELLGNRSCPPQMVQRPSRSSNRQPDRVQKPCLFCLLSGQSTTAHRSSACTKYSTWLQRRDLLESKDHCIRCLQPHTKRDNCPKRKLSDQCWQKCHVQKDKLGNLIRSSRNHHALLCSVRYPDPKDKKHVNWVKQDDSTKGYSSDESDHSVIDTAPQLFADYGDEPPTDSEDEGPYISMSVTQKEETMMAIGTHKRTLMMTAMADVSNASDASLKQPCAIFFDTGSSDTLITKELASQLGLRILKRSTTTFHSFGAEPKGRDEETWKVQFNVHLIDGTPVRLEADAVDGICNKLPSAPLTEGAIERALIRPRLAVRTTSVQPQVLIGIDQQHLFRLRPRSERLPNGFVVWDSLLGPILCGRGEAESQNKAETVQTVNFVFGSPKPEAPTKAPVRTNAVSEIVSKSPELKAIESMASLEGIGIESPEKVNEEELILERHRESLTRLEDGRYEVSFPFRDQILELLRVGKHPRRILPTNYGPALARLNSVWKTHLRDNPQSREAYSNTFELQLSLKIIEQVSQKDDKDLPWLVHYLAHHPVFRADKPTQLRIVFDGSARSGPGTRSLNDCLHPGPSLLESLIGILLRSRGAKILIIGDIEKAFLQIGLRLKDRDVTRFLWLKDPSKPPTPENLVVYRYCRIPFGLNSSPFLLLATIDHHLRQVGSTASSEIRLNTYSDNVFLLAHTPEEGVAKYKESKLIFREMKMNIREFISNDSQFSEAIPQEDRAKQTKESTLGHEWDSQQDVWVFRLPEPNPFKRAQETPTETSNGERTTTPAQAEQSVMVSRKVKTAKFLTKRVLLSILHALWDPLGYFAPLTLQARLVHQELWALDTKLKWDAPVPEPITKSWEAATASWSGVSFEIQRHMFSEGRPASLQLHVFVDASADGYGGVAYLRVKSADSGTYTRIVYAKNRVKSSKPVLTIPRKELMAALIGCRMVTFLRKELLPELQRLHVLSEIPVYLWGDNQGVLYWIKDSAHVYGKFVQNRLAEIRLTPDVTFRYVPTKDNPADVLSRGATTYELRSHALWWHGAPWLTMEDAQWPEQPSDFQPFSEDLLGADAKVKDAEEVQVHVTTRLESRKASPPLLSALNGAIPADRRSYARIRRVLTMVVRFVGNCVERRGKRVLRLPFLRSFSPSHTINAPEVFRRLIQYQATELLLVWEAQHAFPPTPAQASQFNVETFPDGLLRCRGRLERGPLAFDTVNPIWLPEKTRVAKHVVLATHIVNAHAPVETTLALIRRRFWLIKGRRNIRQIIARSCKGCQLVRGPAFRIPDFAQLPQERVSQSRPFAHIGLDLFGPFQVRMGTAKQADISQPATKRRGRQATTRPSDNQPSDLAKVSGVIFTCMATRAVHLEVTHSQSAEHLMHAMDRFMCCRGHPSSVTSDNAPSIILVNRALAVMWKSTMADPVMQVYARSHGIEWHFITPESPWQGGFYERLIRSVKHCLTASIGRRRLEFSDFTRLLARVAHTLNCRPLTYQSEGDVNAVALRPLDFLQPLAEDTTNMGPASEDTSDPDFTHKLSSEERLIKLYAKQNAILEAFWERWRQEYLLSLRERQRQLKNANRLDRDPQVGEYVLVDDDEPIPRPFWKLARIIRLVPGRDGVVRIVKRTIVDAQTPA